MLSCWFSGAGVSRWGQHSVRRRLYSRFDTLKCISVFNAWWLSTCAVAVDASDSGK